MTTATDTNGTPTTYTTNSGTAFDDYNPDTGAGQQVTAPPADDGVGVSNARAMQSTDLHRILQSAYSFIRGVETNSAIAGLTLDHLLKDHIQSLKKGQKRTMSDATGSGFDARPSRWDQIDDMEKKFNKVIELLEQVGDDKAKLVGIGVYEVDVNLNLGNVNQANRDL